MKEGAFKILGITLISLGILGFLLMSTNILGFAISDQEDSNLIFSEIEDITLKRSDQKTVKVNVKNTGENELTTCLMIPKGEKADWALSGETKNIPPNSNIDFNLEITIPEDAEIDAHLLELQITCDQETTSKQTSISITLGVDAINIREMKSEKNFLKIIYTFNPEGLVGDTTYVEIWVQNPDGFEVNRVQDEFKINTDSLIVRNIKIDLKKNPKGVYGVFFSHPTTDKDSYIPKKIILGRSKTSGKAVFDIVEGKGIPYAGFLLFIAIGIFFIFRSHRKSVQAASGSISTTPKLRPINKG